MPMNTIIGRTERVRKLKALLQEKQVVYLSAFYCAGKTVLLDQLAKSLEGTVLRFDMGRDDWNVFQNQAQDTPKATLLIDSLHRLDDATAQSLASLIAKLDAGQCVVMAGRAQLPTYLRQLCATNVITVLDKDFVLMDEEEIIQLFLEYGVNRKRQRLFKRASPLRSLWSVTIKLSPCFSARPGLIAVKVKPSFMRMMPMLIYF